MTDGAHGGWSSNEQTVGSWVRLAWSHARTVRRVTLERNALSDAGIRAGFLSFSDGSQVQVALAQHATRTPLPVTPRRVRWVRFTVTDVDHGAKRVRLTRFTVDGARRAGGVATSAPASGDVASSARIETSSGGETAERSSGAAFTSTDPVGSWTELTWTEPRELTTVAIAGTDSPAQLRSATLTFSDGSTLAMGGVTVDPTRPTIVSFMPRVTTSVRITVDSVRGSGELTLSGISAYQVGARALGVPAASQASPAASTEPPASSCAATTRPTDAVGIVVLCPTNAGHVGQRPTVVVAAGPSYTSVTAAVWPSDLRTPSPFLVRAPVRADGRAVLTLHLRRIPPGPFTVHLVGTGPGVAAKSANFQLDRSGGASAVPTSAGTAPSGRTMVFDENFDHPLSISHDGSNASYAGAKPEYWGVGEFSDAIFADPASGFGNEQGVDGRYLRLTTAPNQHGFTDYNGWGRTHTGGMLASARPGGSGFSAQYGYFEARMLAPSTPGTWPAFWMLPTDNLVTPQSTVAEIDATELYGVNPRGSCSTTHSYRDGKGVAGQALCDNRFATERQGLAWHTYGVDVQPTEIDFYIDGKQIASTPQVPGGEDPMFFMVNLALGGGWPVTMASVQDRSSLYVDWIHVYV